MIDSRGELLVAAAICCREVDSIFGIIGIIRVKMSNTRLRMHLAPHRDKGIWRCNAAKCPKSPTRCAYAGLLSRRISVQTHNYPHACDQYLVKSCTGDQALATEDTLVPHMSKANYEQPSKGL